MILNIHFFGLRSVLKKKRKNGQTSTKNDYVFQKNRDNKTMNEDQKIKPRYLQLLQKHLVRWRQNTLSKRVKVSIEMNKFSSNPINTTK